VKVEQNQVVVCAVNRTVVLAVLSATTQNRVTNLTAVEEQHLGMSAVGWQGLIESTVTGLGFDLVEVDRSARGLLRVYIDRVPGHSYPESQGVGEFVTVDDCEVVTRQLQYALEVDNVDYERLEVSSPGLDRPLKKPADYVRFAGQAIDLALKLAFQGRKHWKGVLQPGETQDQWRLVLDGSHGVNGAGSELAFTLDEVREARLVPVIDFKRGRSTAAPGDKTHPGSAPKRSARSAKTEERSVKQ
jgi:ribosome maturation factor RimP